MFSCSLMHQETSLPLCLLVSHPYNRNKHTLLSQLWVGLTRKDVKYWVYHLVYLLIKFLAEQISAFSNFIRQVKSSCHSLLVTKSKLESLTQYFHYKMTKVLVWSMDVSSSNLLSPVQKGQLLTAPLCLILPLSGAWTWTLGENWNLRS